MILDRAQTDRERRAGPAESWAFALATDTRTDSRHRSMRVRIPASLSVSVQFCQLKPAWRPQNGVFYVFRDEKVEGSNPFTPIFDQQTTLAVVCYILGHD